MSGRVADLPPGSCYSFGAHVVFRQGFKTVQIQGVEFAKLGQPGKMGHYPIHFHMARQVPPDTFIKDSTINESMTRWIVLHSTQGVLLQRNIGYKSIGHGFYLESGTETDNKFYSNLGIFARAAVDNPQNPRKLPGILAYTGEFFKPTMVDGKPVTAPLPADAFPWRTDYQHPTVFWITNGWNDFVGNMAAGAGACGAAYWFVPAWNSDMPDVKTSSNTEFKTHMKWNGFASLQKDESLAGSTPLKSFYGNYATSTMTSFQTVAITAPCPGPDWPGDPAAKNPGHFPGITSFAPTPEAPNMTEMDMYYPHIGGGGRMATKCPSSDGERGLQLHGLHQRTDVVLQQRQGAALLRRHRARPLHLLLPLGRDEFLGDLAAAAMVSGRQQRADRCPERRPQLHHQRHLRPLRGGRGRLGGGEDQRVRRQYAEGGDKLLRLEPHPLPAHPETWRRIALRKRQPAIPHVRQHGTKASAFR